MSRMLFISAITGIFILLGGCTEKNYYTNPPIDHTPPVVAWVSPSPDDELSGEVELRFTASDTSGIDRISVYRNGLNPQDWIIYPQTLQDTLHTLAWDTRQVADALYILEIRAVDNAGNLATSPSLMVRVQNGTPPAEDRTPPEILWLGPDPDSMVADSALLEFSVTDSGGVTDVILVKDGYRAIRLEVQPAGEYEYHWDARSELAGVHTWEVRAYDRAGNEGRSAVLSLRVAGEAEPDRLPPDLWWDSPEPGATLTDTVLVRLNYFDESGVDSVQLLLDGALVYSPPLAGGNEGGVQYLWNTLSDSDGVHLWEAVAWDAAGNQGRSNSLLVRVQNHEPPAEDRTPPVITWLSPASGDTVEGTVNLRFQVADDVGLDSIKVLLDGREWQNLEESQNYYMGNVTWITMKGEIPIYIDSRYFFSIEATDAAGNRSMSRSLILTLWNLRPRVIWVPDEYETIQGAINASRDGDTVRVRAGTYREGVRLMGKEIWLESEEGAERTIIDAVSYSTGIRVYGVQTNSTIRGFTVIGEVNGIATTSDGTVNIYNCIIQDDSHYINGLYLNAGDVSVLNCIVDGAHRGTFTGYITGRFFNTIFVNCNVAYYKLATYEYWIDYGWNLFWNNMEDYRYETPKESDVFDDPRFMPRSYILGDDSPAIDHGNPDLKDKDGSRSDIGIYGGLFSY